MTSSSGALDWPELVTMLSKRFAQLPNHLIDNLQTLLDAGRSAVGCAESALMVPTPDGDHLRFLVSVNSKPGIEDILADIKVPCDGSVVGCVFNTGQLMAIANPEDFYQEVDKKTGLNTSIYLVAPVIDDEEVIGVATFVNRPEGQGQEPFDEKEIQWSMRVADIAAAGLKYFHRVSLQQRLFSDDLARVAERFADGSDEGLDSLHEIGLAQREEMSPLERAIVSLEKLSRREQDLAAELIGVVSSYVGQDESQDFGDDFSMLED